MNAKQQRVAEELAAAATDEKDELSQLPEDLQLRILECIDAPQDCAHLSLASPRLGLAALRANPALPPFWDPIFAIAMRFATDPAVGRVALLRRYAADARASSTHFAWLKEASPSHYLVESALGGVEIWRLRCAQFALEPMLRKRKDGITRHYAGWHERLVRMERPRNPLRPKGWISADYEGETERLVRMEYGNGSVKYYEGESRAERKVRSVYADGAVKFYEGEQGAERQVRIDYPTGSVQHYEGERGAERLVRAEKLNGEVWYYEGERRAERLLRKERFIREIEFYEGERGAEKLAHAQRAMCRPGELV